LPRFLLLLVSIFLGVSAILPVQAAHADIFEDKAAVPSGQAIAEFANKAKAVSGALKESRALITDAQLTERMNGLKEGYNFWREVWSPDEKVILLNYMRYTYSNLSHLQESYPENLELKQTLEKAKDTLLDLSHDIVNGLLDNTHFSANDRIEAVDLLLRKATDDINATIIKNIEYEKDHPSEATPISDMLNAFSATPKKVMQSYETLLSRMGLDPDRKFLDEIGEYAVGRVGIKQLKNVLALAGQHTVCGAVTGCVAVAGYLLFKGPLSSLWAAAIIGFWGGYVYWTPNKSDTATHPFFFSAFGAKEDLASNVGTRQNAIFTYARTIDGCKTLLSRQTAVVSAVVSTRPPAQQHPHFQGD